jgi:hypothetical protein
MGPRIVPWGDRSVDRIGGVMTSRMVRYIMALHKAQDSIKAADAVDVERDAMVTMVRYVEKKVGYRLFARLNGARNSQWLPLPGAAKFFEWCATNPAGGADFPNRP